MFKILALAFLALSINASAQSTRSAHHGSNAARTNPSGSRSYSSDTNLKRLNEYKDVILAKLPGSASGLCSSNGIQFINGYRNADSAQVELYPEQAIQAADLVTVSEGSQPLIVFSQFYSLRGAEFQARVFITTDSTYSRIVGMRETIAVKEADATKLRDLDVIYSYHVKASEKCL